MQAPTVEEVQNKIRAWAPNFVYFYGGCQQRPDEGLVNATVGSVKFPAMDASGRKRAAKHMFAQ